MVNVNVIDMCYFNFKTSYNMTNYTPQNQLGMYYLNFKVSYNFSCCSSTNIEVCVISIPKQVTI